jgi:2-polyprenyl-3-methyl-5-hydroxy-6-metoxy-1,4-benzoquinol methylase
MTPPATEHAPAITPERIFETLNAYNQSAALKAAIELEIFTAIGEGATSAPALAQRCQAAERGVRILCDYLVIYNFLTKNGNSYGLAADSAIFLNKRSPAYIGAAAGFIVAPEMVDRSKDLTAAVRNGASSRGDQATADPNNPIWVEFARSMTALQRMTAQNLAEFLGAASGGKWKVLDIAAGHGMYGVAVATANPDAQIYALDWPAVLQVAKENAKAAGVADRIHEIPGSVFEADFGKDYDVVLLTGFLHHFDPQAIDTLLRKVHSALKPGGRAVTVEFVPNDDRVSPPTAAAFSLIMLSTTRGGEAYTFSEYEGMFRKAGFTSSEIHATPGPQNIIVSKK